MGSDAERRMHASACPREAEGARRREARSRMSGGSVERKANPPGNELGLSGMDLKEDITVTHGGDLPMNNSYTLL